MVESENKHSLRPSFKSASKLSDGGRKREKKRQSSNESENRTNTEVALKAGTKWRCGRNDSFHYLLLPEESVTDVKNKSGKTFLPNSRRNGREKKG